MFHIAKIDDIGLTLFLCKHLLIGKNQRNKLLDHRTGSLHLCKCLFGRTQQEIPFQLLDLLFHLIAKLLCHDPQRRIHGVILFRRKTPEGDLLHGLILFLIGLLLRGLF